MMASVSNPSRALSSFLLVCLVLAVPLHAGQLLGSDVWSSALLDIDRNTAQWSLIGNMGQVIGGMAYDPNHDVLYGISASTDNIYRIDYQTGQATRIGAPGALGYDNANGLAYDPRNDLLYGTDNNTNTLFTVDVKSGVGTPVAPIGGGFTEIEGLGFDAAGDKLYGLTQLQRRIVEIDPRTGAAVAVSDVLPSLVWRGLDYDAERHLLYASAVRVFGNAPLYSFDPVSKQLSFVGDMVGIEAVQGLAYVPEPSGAALLMILGLLLKPRR